MRVAAIGGGHGLARALSALRRLDVAPTAVVTVADDGGSSGRLRRDLGIIALGDLRMALLTLADDERLADLLAHRYARGELEGHALGNLLLLALGERRGGDYVAALDDAASLLRCRGRVLPATTAAVQLKARVAGAELDGQVRVATAGGRIERVWLDPSSPPAPRDAVEALREADAVVLGPGSLFTSVVATLLVPELADALVATRGRVVYVCNLTTQPGETSGLDVRAHVDALVAHVPGLVLDTVLVHDGPAHAPDGTLALSPDLEHPAVRQVLRADLAARGPEGRPRWGHDPARLADALARALDPAQRPG